MRARRLLSTLFAAAMFSTSCATFGQSSAPDVPPPAVDESINTEAAFPADGLTRLILTPIAGAPIVSASSDAEGAAGSTGTSGEPVDPSRLLTPEMVAAMPPGAVLEARDGEVGYVDADGTFVAFDPAMLPDPTPTTAASTQDEAEPEPAIEPLYGNPYIDALAADPAIKNVIVVGDGTYGIETSDPSVIDPNIFSVAEDTPLGIATDQYERYQWHLENDGTNLNRVIGSAITEDADLDIDPTVERFDGRGVVVAVIDSGVDFSHGDLQNSAWSNLEEVCDNGVDDDANGYVDDCNGWDFAYNDAEPYNLGANLHGTHVAGIITAERNGTGVAGVAPGTRIMDLNVAYPNGSMTSSAITAAIRYAVDNGADVINMSLGTNPGASASRLGGMSDAIDYAAANGVLIVAAAGNSNVDIGSLAVYPASFDRSNMVVVGSSGPTDQRSGFSNYGSSVVDLFAPGEVILSTTPGNDFRFMSGTSMASPAVAGVVALLMEANPEAGVDLLIEQLLSTVDPSDELSTSITGGRANAASALGLGDAPAIPTELNVAIAGLLGAENEVAAEVSIVTPPEAFEEDYRWELSLLTTVDTGTYAVIEHPFVVDGAEAATGVTGALVLGTSAVESVSVSTQLPDGRYSFVVEAVPTADGNARLGDAFVTSFEIGDGTIEVDETTTTVPGATTSTTAPGVSPTTSPAPDGSAPSTSSPGTAAPGENSDPTSGDGGATSTTADPGGDAPATTNPVETDGTTTTPSTVQPVEPGAPVTTAPIGPITTAPPAVPTTEAGSPSTTTPATGGDSSGGAPSTTTPPATTPGTTPPSTLPTSPAPVPPSVGDDTAADGEWAIDSISPQAGYVDNANTVTIRGAFPDTAYVWFGGQPGQVVFQSDDLITVRTPLRSAEGVVDVSLRTSAAGTVLTVDDAYAFVGWGSDQPTTGTPGDGSTNDGTTNDGNGNGGNDSTGDGGSDDGDNSAGDSPNNGGTDGGGDADDGGADSGGDTTDGSDDDEPVGDRRSRMIVGSAIELSNGLRGAAISPNPAANTPLCSTDPCVATRG